MSRREFFEMLWERYDRFHIFLILVHPGLDLPEGVPEVAKGLTMLILEPNNYGNNYEEYDPQDDALYITLSFRPSKYTCRIPWNSIAIFGTEDFQVNWAIDGKDLEPTKPEKPKLSVVK